MGEHLLIVEDDVFVQKLLAAYMRQAGYEVSQAGSGKEMFAILDRGGVDLIILDLNLPDEDGLVLARKVRIRWPVPIMVLSARSDRSDRLAALKLGADDYLVKPADPEELALRVRNVLNRSSGAAPVTPERRRPGTLRFNGWRLDIPGFSLTGPDGPVPLTPGEFRLLSALVKADNRVLSRDQLLDAVSDAADAPGDRVIDVLISRLRKKMEPDPRNPTLIVTVVGLGYKFAGRVE